MSWLECESFPRSMILALLRIKTYLECDKVVLTIAEGWQVIYNYVFDKWD